MTAKQSARLFASANWVIMLAVIGALVAAQWKHEAIPLAILGALLVLTVIKARLIILDFMGLRDARPAMAVALWTWPALFSLAALGRALGSIWLG
jgi:hypothetical protein|nr:membrane protein [Rhizobium sp. Q54]